MEHPYKKIPVNCVSPMINAESGHSVKVCEYLF
jgi:hypothetical protein